MSRRRQANRAEAIVRGVGALIMLGIILIMLPMLPKILKGKSADETLRTMFGMIVGFVVLAGAIAVVGLIVWLRVQRGKGRMQSNGPKFLGSSEETCPECGQPMIIRRGKWGAFWGCSTYPRCRGKRNIENNRM